MARAGGLILFGSAMKAIRTHPEAPRAIDRDAVAEGLRLGYIPAPRSLWRDVRKLMPGGIVTTDLDAPDDWRHARFWDPLAEMRAARAARFDGPPEAAVDVLEERLSAAVAGQMVADVPLVAFLSGGVDSGTVMALMQRHSARPVQCFTIGFDDMPSEVEDARAMAAHLGAEPARRAYSSSSM